MDDKPDFANQPQSFANGSRLQFAMRELRLIFGSKKLWSVFAFVVGLFVVIGPFGTANGMSLPMRVLYWTSTQSVAWSIAIIVIVCAATYLGDGKSLSLRNLMMGGALAAIPIHLAVEMVTLLFIADADFSPLSPWSDLVQNFAITMLMPFLVYLTLGKAQPAQNLVNASETIPPPQPIADQVPLLKRLPIAKRGSASAHVYGAIIMWRSSPTKVRN